ncbi:MAG: hypothetical protein GXO72_03155 [Caldiserica bacterium]|nr:hypothetical protein [Caldisericota bacterium]
MRGGGKFLAGYIGGILGTAVAIMGLAALGLYLAGARDARQYGSVFAMLGLGAWAVGALSVLGSWGSTRSFSHQYPSSVSRSGSPERARQLMRDTLATYGFLIRCSLVGAILVGVGALLYFR